LSRPGTAEPARISVKRASGGYFTTLGTEASVGRVFTDADGTSRASSSWATGYGTNSWTVSLTPWDASSVS